MKSFCPILLACALAMPALAQDAKTNAAPAIPAVMGAVSAPLVLTNGYISSSLTEMTDAAGGGKAVYSFTITNAGTYVIQAVVNAPDDSANSFFVNIDGPAEDSMIWDIEVTNGFEERTVNWRGTGESGSGEFVPKRFKLSAGAHKVNIAGREPAQLKSISIRPAAN